MLCLLFVSACLIGCSCSDVTLEGMTDTLTTLAKQTMMQQLSTEERVRSAGHSGLKQVRFGKDGDRAYQTNSHVGTSGTASMHEHADHYKTVGLGEFMAVMNGVEFRTRHNDYQLFAPSKTSTLYKAVEEIEYPEVPPEVLQYQDVQEQTLEMQKWFQAWASQDYSVRDYRKYFKPLLCYLEATWTESSSGQVEEPFDSDRHHLDSQTWWDMQEKIRWYAYTGGKDKNENLAFLPTKIFSVNASTAQPHLSQWNYRILCHKIKEDVPLRDIRYRDDLHARLTAKKSLQDMEDSKKARFDLDNFGNPGDRKAFRWSYLESLMNQIPGMDNYPAYIDDNTYGHKYQDPFFQDLNAGYYHSWFRYAFKDAMGLGFGHRSFSDRHLFFAFNRRPEITPRTVRYCDGPWYKPTECKTNVARVSYAIPLELVWTTPLQTWNPYNIQFKTDNRKYTQDVETKTRKGGFSKATAFNGNDRWHFYRTPQTFFTTLQSEEEVDAADTAFDVAGVLDNRGEVRNVTASGIRIFLPKIPGIERRLRQRYPVFPVHEEGSTVYKEAKALEEIIMDMKRYTEMFLVKPN